MCVKVDRVDICGGVQLGGCDRQGGFPSSGHEHPPVEFLVEGFEEETLGPIHSTRGLYEDSTFQEAFFADAIGAVSEVNLNGVVIHGQGQVASSIPMGASTANSVPNSSMRVVAVGSQGRTRLETRERPLPGPGELVLQLRACGLCGTDLFKLAGGTVAAGSVLGHELVGTVVELGKGTSGFSVGERVTVPHHVACGVCALCRRGSETLCEVFRENLLEPGGFAEYVLVKPRAVEQAAYRVPEGLSDEAAVFLEPAACVLRGILRAGFRVGENSALASGTARAPGIEAQGSAGADDGLHNAPCKQSKRQGSFNCHCRGSISRQTGTSRICN